jgi:hypothetical protein
MSKSDVSSGERPTGCSSCRLMSNLFSAAINGERLHPHQPAGTGIYFASCDTGRKMAEIGRMIGRSLGVEKIQMIPCPPLTVLTIAAFYEALQFFTGKTPPIDWAKAWESQHH